MHGQGKFSTPLQAGGYEILVVVFHENRGPQLRARDQGGPPILADVGHLHDLEHRLSNPRLGDELGDGYYDFGWQLTYGTELVLGGNDALDDIFEGGMKFPELFPLALVARSIEN